MSSIMAEIFLQYYKHLLIKHRLETNMLCYYVPFIDDILILFDTRKITEEIILREMNLLHKIL
jgi:hypothetical protein